MNQAADYFDQVNDLMMIGHDMFQSIQRDRDGSRAGIGAVFFKITIIIEYWSRQIKVRNSLAGRRLKATVNQVTGGVEMLPIDDPVQMEGSHFSSIREYEQMCEGLMADGDESAVNMVKKTKQLYATVVGMDPSNFDDFNPDRMIEPPRITPTDLQIVSSGLAQVKERDQEHVDSLIMKITEISRYQISPGSTPQPYLDRLYEIAVLLAMLWHRCMVAMNTHYTKISDVLLNLVNNVGRTTKLPSLVSGAFEMERRAAGMDYDEPPPDDSRAKKPTPTAEMM